MSPGGRETKDEEAKKYPAWTAVMLSVERARNSLDSHTHTPNCSLTATFVHSRPYNHPDSKPRNDNKDCPPMPRKVILRTYACGSTIPFKNDAGEQKL